MCVCREASRRNWLNTTADSLDESFTSDGEEHAKTQVVSSPERNAIEVGVLTQDCGTCSSWRWCDDGGMPSVWSIQVKYRSLKAQLKTVLSAAGIAKWSDGAIVQR